MKYQRFGNTVVVRIDKGEEVLEQIKEVALRENIKLASVSAIGATDDFTVGVYDVAKQEYKKLTFTGSFEIISLLGTINTMDGAFYTHLHMSAGDTNGHVFGGHLNRAQVSITCEMVITEIDGTVDRFRDPALGVNLLAL